MTQMKSMNEIIQESNIVSEQDEGRNFSYFLNDKTLKSKLIKGAKKEPVHFIENQSSANIYFNLGSEKAIKNILYRRKYRCLWYFKSHFDIHIKSSN